MKTPVLIALILVLLLPVVTLVATQNVDQNDTTNTPTQSPTSTPEPTNSTSMTEPTDAISASQVILKTSLGDITLNLFPNEAPLTVKNFVTLGKRGYYNDLIFHRVIKDFVIQGGDPTGTGAGGESIYGKKFQDEINNHKIVVGSLAMANAGPNTNGSQFFIVTASDQPGLDGVHTNFGQVADDASMQVVKAIAAVEVDGNDRPTTPVKMTGFTVVK